MTSGDATAAPGVKIQGVDIMDLTSGIHVYEPSVVHVPLRFGEVYASWVKVAGLVQGWDLSEDAILQGSPNIVFTSLKIFLASVTITGSFRAASGLSGVDSDKSCSDLEFDKLLIKGKLYTA
ncbi:hypothetical protein Hamer_G012945 [Homarus americanus]|uniref:Uncharacterized protein n=1 Tax=Homarus americanus TaxID=6706 RepID=A0A8J5MXX6_HOMAM|nr:hypothetical protein Hamer_G012945 [Homarus americanus]